MKTLALSLVDIAIHQDQEGRFCLNDLHKAAGNNPAKKPSEWLRNQKTQEFIEYLSGNMSIEKSVVTLKGGKTPGVYVVKELVYAYAMWLSPKFHLEVIRAYDDMVTKGKLPGFLFLNQVDNRYLREIKQ